MSLCTCVAFLPLDKRAAHDQGADLRFFIHPSSHDLQKGIIKDILYVHISHHNTNNILLYKQPLYLYC